MSKPKDKCRSCPLAKVAGDNARKAGDMDALADYFKDKADNAINERDALQIQNEALHKALAAMQAIENGRRKSLWEHIIQETRIRLWRVK